MELELELERDSERERERERESESEGKRAKEKESGRARERDMPKLVYQITDTCAVSRRVPIIELGLLRQSCSSFAIFVSIIKSQKSALSSISKCNMRQTFVNFYRAWWRHSEACALLEDQDRGRPVIFKIPACVCVCVCVRIHQNERAVLSHDD
jgi:hypothetical protein